MGQHLRTPALRKPIAWVCFVVLLTVLTVAYHSRAVRQRRISEALADINAITYAQPVWRCPGPVNAYCGLTGSTPPDAFKGYVIQLSPAQITDTMVDHLIAIDSLDSLIVKTARATGQAVVSPLPLRQLPTAASQTSILRLSQKYPDLFLYVDSGDDFETVDSDRAGSKTEK